MVYLYRWYARVRGYGMPAEQYDEDLKRKVEYYHDWTDDDNRPAFVLVYQLSYPDKTVFVGPWDPNEFEFTETEVVLRDGDYVFQRDMIAGFFEIHPHAPMDWNSYDKYE